MPKTSLGIINKFYPNVRYVVDAKHVTEIEVMSKDQLPHGPKSHTSCALAEACKRKFKADGMIISVTTAYVIKGDKATRYRVPANASREIVAFDRKLGFAAGVYGLRPPNQHSNGSGGHAPSHGQSGRKIRRRHVTAGIRTSLNAA